MFDFRLWRLFEVVEGLEARRFYQRNASGFGVVGVNHLVDQFGQAERHGVITPSSSGSGGINSARITSHALGECFDVWLFVFRGWNQQIHLARIHAVLCKTWLGLCRQWQFWRLNQAFSGNSKFLV